MTPMQRYLTPTVNDVWVYTGSWPVTIEDTARDYFLYDPVQIQMDDYGDLVSMQFQRGNALPSAFAHGRDWGEEEEGETFEHFSKESLSPELTPEERVLYKGLRTLYMALGYYKSLPELNELLIELEI